MSYFNILRYVKQPTARLPISKMREGPGWRAGLAGALLVLCCALMPMVAMGQQLPDPYTVQVGDFNWDPATGQIGDYNNANAGGVTNIIIPSDFGDTPIRVIDNRAFQNDGLTSVIIPSTVTKIGNQAFRDNNLDNVTIPSSVTDIGNNAFNGNAGLSVTLQAPSRLHTIGNNVFTGTNMAVQFPATAYMNGVDWIDNNNNVVAFGDNIANANSYLLRNGVGQTVEDDADLFTLSTGNSITAIRVGNQTVNPGLGDNDIANAAAININDVARNASEEDRTLILTDADLNGASGITLSQAASAVFVENDNGNSVDLVNPIEQVFQDGVPLLIKVTAANGDDSFYSVTMNLVNEPPAIDNGGPLVVNYRGAGATIEDDLLSANDPDGDNGAIIYTVTTLPAHGTLSVDGAPPIVMGGTFTQQNIVDDQVTYTHTADDDMNDSFTFSITDDDNQSEMGLIFEITVNPTAPGQVMGLQLGVPGVGDGTVSLTWDALGVANTGGTVITGYNVQFREVEDPQVANFVDVTTVANLNLDVATRTAMVSSLDNGTTYDFRVRAVNDVGQGPYSTVLQATPAIPPPARSFQDVAFTAANTITLTASNEVVAGALSFAAAANPDRTNVFTISPPLGTVTAAIVGNDDRTIMLTTQNDAQSGIEYTIELTSDRIEDAGNAAVNDDTDYTAIYDNTPPILTVQSTNRAREIILESDEDLMLVPGVDPNNNVFNISGGINVTDVSIEDNFTTITLTLNANLADNTDYVLTIIADKIQDHFGNRIVGGTEYQFNTTRPTLDGAAFTNPTTITLTASKPIEFRNPAAAVAAGGAFTIVPARGDVTAEIGADQTTVTVTLTDAAVPGVPYVLSAVNNTIQDLFSNPLADDSEYNVMLMLRARSFGDAAFTSATTITLTASDAVVAGALSFADNVDADDVFTISPPLGTVTADIVGNDDRTITLTTQNDAQSGQEYVIKLIDGRIEDVGDAVVNDATDYTATYDADPPVLFNARFENNNTILLTATELVSLNVAGNEVFTIDPPRGNTFASVTTEGGVTTVEVQLAIPAADADGVYTLSLNADAIQDESDNAADSREYEVIYDVTSPTFSDARFIDNQTISLIASEDVEFVDRANFNPEAAGAVFTLGAGVPNNFDPGTVTVVGIGEDDRTITLTIENSLDAQNGETFLLSLIANTIEDQYGNEASPGQVANVLYDAAAPTILVQEFINATTIALFFNEEVSFATDVDGLAPNTVFIIDDEDDGNDPIAVERVTIAPPENQIITVTLGSPATDGMYSLEILPNTIEDIAGKPVASMAYEVNYEAPDEEAPVIAPDQEINYVQNRAANDDIGTVEATDNVAVTEFIIVSGDDENFFDISNAGVITITADGVAANSPANAVNTAPNVFELGIGAIDGAGNRTLPPVTVTLEVQASDVADVPVVDSNQEHPYEENQEEGAEIYRVTVDNKGFFVTGFSIEGSNPAIVNAPNPFFTIDETGLITMTANGVASAFNNFEVNPNDFTLTIIATNRNGDSTPVNVRLTVEDKDEIAPMITAPPAALPYNENQVAGATIGQVVATEQGGGQVESYAIIAVALQAGDAFPAGINAATALTYFQINNDGDISLTAAGVGSFANDAEIDPDQFILSITATDDSDNTTDPAVGIPFQVNDVDEGPVFGALNPANGQYTENQGAAQGNSGPSGTIVTVDADDPEAVAAVVAYAITGGNDDGYFQIGQDNGEIALTEAGRSSPANDFEVGPNEFTLTITATSGGATNEEITISVTDNENPEIVAGQVFNYSEGQNVGFEIGTVRAFDADIQGFAIVRVEGPGIVADNAGADQVLAATAFDFFDISDAGVISLTATGAADNAASDDFATAPNGFQLIITANDADGNSSAETTVTLNVFAEDTQNPEIDPGQEFSYVEGQALNTAFEIPGGMVEADDDVQVRNFSIESVRGVGRNREPVGDPAVLFDYFSIEEATGLLSLTAAGAGPENGPPTVANDWEEQPNIFILGISAEDPEGNSTGTVNVTVRVLNKDEAAPTISSDQMYSYKENREADDVIATVRFEDTDGNMVIEPDGTVTELDGMVTEFDIVSVSGDGIGEADDDIITADVALTYFAIDVSGDITLTTDGLAGAANDFEEAPNSFTLNITATDGTNAIPDVQAVPVILNVTNVVDEEAPTVTPLAQSGSYEENQASGTTIFTVVGAVDDVGVTEFDIVSVSGTGIAAVGDVAGVGEISEETARGYFQINASGDISLTPAGTFSAANDFEDDPTNEFTLSIVASDAAGNESAPVVVILTVADVDDNVAVTSVTINQLALSLAIGASQRLTATVLPDNATNSEVVWESSDDNIVEVEANTGVVTAIAEGDAEITASAGGQTSTTALEVTVSAASGPPQGTPVTSLSITGGNIELKVGGTQTLTAMTDPANVTVIWSSSNDDVATVDENSGLVTAEGTGAAVITATAGGRNASVIVTVDPVLGLPAEDNVAIYPNPVSNILSIDLPKEMSSSACLIQILDIDSRLIKSSVHKGGTSLQVDVRDLADGVHFIVLKSNGNELRHRFIKQ